jgi:dTDP-4-dehydrorhamnose 3,5-epimerase
MNTISNSLKIINGVAIRNLSKIENEKGNILHVIKSTDDHFSNFGECYISEIYPGKVKAWKKNNLQTQNLAVIEGNIKFVIFDDRKNSNTKNQLNIFEINRNINYKLLTIPPNVWYGFCCIGDVKSVIVNCSNYPHDPKNITSLDVKNNLIPFNW